ncbi:glutamate receptor ionotropic, kainate 4-like [Pollicipes pollicipes]|uniref:glutamate receptor ionotropic, kainate 4-like n=1 Tax=Pollicipes pollicipes TaxID=41117 RepID=UPI001884E3AF|nr:glutamate receptor ionotropic, kainate 4-like [Pollicipes pollicipes]
MTSSPGTPEDVAVVHDRPPSYVRAVWEAVHARARSVQLVQLAGDWAQRPRPVNRRHMVTKVCIFWLRDANWRQLKPLDPESFLDAWGNRCGRLVVVESKRSISDSASMLLVNYDHAQTISSVMIGNGPDNVTVFGHRIDCVRQELSPLLLYDSARGDTVRRLFWPNRVELRGQHLRVTSTAASNTPYASFANPDDQSAIVGVEAEMLEAVARGYGFNFSMVHPASNDGLFGARMPNGSWTGVIGMIVRGEADLAVGDISVTLEREAAVDYTYPFHIEPVSFFMLRPPALPRWLVLVTPFSNTTWLVLLCSLLVGTAVMALLPAMVPGRSPRERLVEASTFVWGAIVEQAVVLEPAGSAARLVVSTWWCFSLTMTICYQTLLTSKLSVPQYPTPIDSLNALALSDLRVKSADKIAVSQYLETFRGTSSVLARIPEKLTFFPVEGRSVAERPDSERYYISRARFYRTGLAWPVRAGACFRPALDRAVLRLLQGGLVELWMRVDVGSTARDRAGARALTMDDLSVAFLALAAGCLLATVCFLLELG